MKFLNVFYALLVVCSNPNDEILEDNDLSPVPYEIPSFTSSNIIIESPEDVPLTFNNMPPEIIDMILEYLSEVEYADYVKALQTLNLPDSLCLSRSKEDAILIRINEQLTHLDYQRTKDRPKMSALKSAIDIIIGKRISAFDGENPLMIPEVIISPLIVDGAPLHPKFRLFIWKALLESSFGRKFIMHWIDSKKMQKTFSNIDDKELLLMKAAAVIGSNYLKEIYTEFGLLWTPKNVSLLIKWAIYGNQERLVKLLMSKVDDVQVDESVVKYASKYGNLLLLDYYFTHYIQLRNIDCKKEVQLSYKVACEYGRTEIFHYLLVNFPNMKPPVKYFYYIGRHGHINLFNYVLDCEYLSNHNDILFKIAEGAAKSGNIDMLKQIFNDERASFTIDMNEQIIVSNAMESGSVDCVKWLIEMREDLRFTALNLTAASHGFYLACKNNKKEMVEFLLNFDEEGKNADPLLDPSVSDNLPLIAACSSGHTAIVELLLRLKVDGSQVFPTIDPSSNDGEALRKAAQEGHVTVLKLLMSRIPDGRYIYLKAEPTSILLLNAIDGRSISSLQYLLSIDESSGQQEYQTIRADFNNNEPLILAVRNNFIPAIQFLLQKKPDGKYLFNGIDPSTTNNLLLDISVKEQMHNMVQFLLQTETTPEGTLQRSFPEINPLDPVRKPLQTSINLNNFEIIYLITKFLYGPAPDYSDRLDMMIWTAKKLHQNKHIGFSNIMFSKITSDGHSEWTRIAMKEIFRGFFS